MKEVKEFTGRYRVGVPGYLRLNKVTQIQAKGGKSYLSQDYVDGMILETKYTIPLPSTSL